MSLKTYAPSHSTSIPHVCLDKPAKPFKSQLSGPTAFYKRPSYIATTEREFSREALLPVTYRVTTEYKITQIAKLVFSTIIFPHMLYKFIHAGIGLIVLPATMIHSRQQVTAIRRQQINNIFHNPQYAHINKQFKYKRITIESDGRKIDAVIIGKPSTLENGRWTLRSLGNGEIYEHYLTDENFLSLLSQTESNAILFDYPNVGSSSSDGLISRKAMVNAYNAVLTFLEDDEKGIGAKEIIGFGHSIGGGIQGDALRDRALKQDKGIRYLFVKSRTFSDLSTEVDNLICRPLGFLIKIFGWNISSVDSSLALKAPEIIFQTADTGHYIELQDSTQVMDDGVIPKNASLASALLDNPDCPRDSKLFIGTGESHNDPIFNVPYLAKRINRMLPHHQETAHWWSKAARHVKSWLL